MTTTGMHETLTIAIEEFIEMIERSQFKSVVVKDKDGRYHAQSDNKIFTDDIRVYGYGSFINSCTDLTIASIYKHIKRIEKRENI